MKKTAIYFFLFIVLALFACKQNVKYGEPTEKPVTILADIRSFLNYRELNTKLCEDFTALDSDSKVITKTAFLKAVATGDYMPLRLSSTDSLVYLKLYKLDANANSDIRMTLKGWGDIELAHYEMEGKPLPTFNFVDLNGKIYDKTTTKGKILVLKCWFIACVPCIAEMPSLNALVKEYETRQDVQFVSLAIDKPESLKAFLTKEIFDYATVPSQEAYMSKSLNIHSYPTHIIVNKQGLIAKVVNNHRDMAVALSKEVAK